MFSENFHLCIHYIERWQASKELSDFTFAFTTDLREADKSEDFSDILPLRIVKLLCLHWMMQYLFISI